MTANRVTFDRRCYDCRALVPADTDGYLVLDRFLCCSCAPDVEHAEAGV